MNVEKLKKIIKWGGKILFYVRDNINIQNFFVKCVVEINRIV